MCSPNSIVGVYQKLSIWEKAKYTLAASLFITVTYFLTQNLVTFSSLSLLLPADSLIPFVPEFIWIYHTLAPVLILSCIFIIKDESNFKKTGLAFIITAIVLNIFYIVMPSFYPREEFEISGVASWLVSLTRELDGSNNTFPSGHVALSWLLLLSMQRVKSIRSNIIANTSFFLWAAGICLSTLFLKQHYLVDVVSGIFLAHMSNHYAQKIYHMKKPAWAAGSSEADEQTVPQLAE